MNQISQFLVTLDFKTVSGFRPDKTNCRKLLYQSIICSACFFKDIKDIENPEKMHRTTSELNHLTVVFLLEHMNIYRLI